MSGRTTHGYNAFVSCDRNPLSYAILSKICYIGHRRFLAKDKPHPRKYRRHVFNAKHENRDAPKRLTADELQVELEKVGHITQGNHPDNGSGKRKRGRAEERDYCLPADPLCGTWSIGNIWICGIILM